MTHVYKVVTTEAIAQEMARYDEAEIEKGKFVRLGILHPITDEAEALAKCEKLGLAPELHLVYQWVLTGNLSPTIER